MLKKSISPLYIIIICLSILIDGSKDGLNLLLVGNTGNGKSATGNTIVGKRLFETSSGVNSLTSDIKRVESNHDGRKLTVVDSPGFIDSRLSPAEYIPVYFDYMSKAIQVSPHGYHAFLFVLRYGVRLTHEDERTFEALSNCFGEEYFTRYGVLVITFTDMFDPEDNNGQLFSDWINTQGGVLREMKNKFGGRVVLLDNKNKDKTNRWSQVENLIKIVDQLSVLNSQYTNDHFELASFQRARYLVEAKLPGIESEVKKELVPAIERFDKIMSDTPEKQINQLYLLKNVITKLLTKIQEQDMGTGVLDEVITGIQKVAGDIQQGIDHVRNPPQGIDGYKYGSGGLISNAINAVNNFLSYVGDIVKRFLARYERPRLTYTGDEGNNKNKKKTKEL